MKDLRHEIAAMSYTTGPSRTKTSPTTHWRTLTSKLPIFCEIEVGKVLKTVQHSCGPKPANGHCALGNEWKNA